MHANSGIFATHIRKFNAFQFIIKHQYKRKNYYLFMKLENFIYLFFSYSELAH